MSDDASKARFWALTGTCPSYCPCRVLDRRGGTPRNPERCPYEAAGSAS